MIHRPVIHVANISAALTTGFTLNLGDLSKGEPRLIANWAELHNACKACGLSPYPGDGVCDLGDLLRFLDARCFYSTVGDDHCLHNLRGMVNDLVCILLETQIWDDMVLVECEHSSKLGITPVLSKSGRALPMDRLGKLNLIKQSTPRLQAAMRMSSWILCVSIKVPRRWWPMCVATCIARLRRRC